MTSPDLTTAERKLLDAADRPNRTERVLALAILVMFLLAETALAMGFAVDEEFVTLTMDVASTKTQKRTRWWERPQPFAALAKALGQDGPFAPHAHGIAAQWRDLLTPLPAGGRVLVIGHSGEIEPGLVACFPDADHASWGPTFGPCEGAKLTFEGELGHFVKVEFLRHRDIGSAVRHEEEADESEERILGL
jgi:hypothetical protein